MLLKSALRCQTPTLTHLTPPPPGDGYAKTAKWLFKLITSQDALDIPGFFPDQIHVIFHWVKAFVT